LQVSYLGYPGTTGLRQIDYRLTDPLADPPGETDVFHIEQLWRLPTCNWCFGPPAQEAVERTQRQGPLCFGTFNNFAKASSVALELWAAILKAVPRARFALKSKGLTQPSVRQRVEGRFSSHGISPDRIDILDYQPDTAAHLRAYDRLDIALDSFPYHGTTTTCEALWMGVPVVTLAGQMHVSRVGVSLLSNAGLAALIAQSRDEYISIAVRLAEDPPRLAALQRRLRGQIRQSPLMDARRFTADVESAYRGMWHRWCGQTGRS
jgi:predicted O-linked N-acetylglucosamine transferase (SPINDLY family)